MLVLEEQSVCSANKRMVQHGLITPPTSLKESTLSQENNPEARAKNPNKVLLE